MLTYTIRKNVLVGLLLAIGSFSLQAAESPPGRKPSDAREGRRVSGMFRPAPIKKKKEREEAMYVMDQGQDQMNPRMVKVSKSKQKRAGDLIQRQEQPLVIPRVLNQVTQANVSIVISLARQRVYLKVGDEIAIDAPICSGKVAGMTPRGQFTILEKDPDHRSSLYGNFVNSSGEVVRSGVSLKIDSAPSGTTFEGAPMRWFMRLTSAGVGMHAGILAGYPASHGCIRLPEQIAKMIYDCVKVGTLVTVRD